MENKLIKIPDTEYFQSEGLSQSFLKAFRISPALAFAERKTTKSMEDGKILHKIIFDDGEESLMIINRLYRNSNQYKEIVKDHPNKIIMFQDEIEIFHGMVKNVNALIYDYVEMKEIIADGQKEISCFSEILGFPAKGKFDLLWNNIIFDLKTTENMERFSYQVKDYKYYRQADWYKTLYSHYSRIPYQNIKFIFIAVENKFPYGAKTFELTSEYEELGAHENMQSIKKYSEWLDRGGDKSEIYLETHEVIGR